MRTGLLRELDNLELGSLLCVPVVGGITRSPGPCWVTLVLVLCIFICCLDLEISFRSSRSTALIQVGDSESHIVGLPWQSFTQMTVVGKRTLCTHSLPSHVG